MAVERYRKPVHSRQFHTIGLTDSNGIATFPSAVKLRSGRHGRMASIMSAIMRRRERARRQRVFTTGADIIADALGETTSPTTPPLRVVRTYDNLRPVGISDERRAPSWRASIALGTLAVTLVAILGAILQLRHDLPTAAPDTTSPDVRPTSAAMPAEPVTVQRTSATQRRRRHALPPQTNARSHPPSRRSTSAAQPPTTTSYPVPAEPTSASEPTSAAATTPPQPESQQRTAPTTTQETSQPPTTTTTSPTQDVEVPLPAPARAQSNDNRADMAVGIACSLVDC